MNGVPGTIEDQHSMRDGRWEERSTEGVRGRVRIPGLGGWRMLANVDWDRGIHGEGMGTSDAIMVNPQPIDLERLNF
jgi:hypothetical protein